MVRSDAARTTRSPVPARTLRTLLAQGRTGEVLALGRRILASAGDPREKAAVSIERLAALFNLGRAASAESREAEDQAAELAREVGSPTALGHFHAIAAAVGTARGAVDQALAHVLDSERYLNREQDVAPTTEQAWYDLATAQGVMGLGDHALASVQRLSQIAEVQQPWLPPRLQAALAMDHIGDTQGAIVELDEILHLGRVRAGAGSGSLLHRDAICYAYAAARRTVLAADPGESADVRIEVRPPDQAADNAFTSAFVLLIQACQAIAAHHPLEALALLDRIGPDCPLPVSELLRVRSLALTEVGDTHGAVEHERRSFRIQSQRILRLQRLMLTRPAADGDGWELSPYVREALTDPLTGLPNRRHLERRMTELATERQAAALALLDLDGFKQVNTIHGHVAGDRVLEQIAAILAAALRTGDFVARYGGDEFVILLPGTAEPEAHAIGSRISSAIATADWRTIAPQTPIGASIGWTEMGAHHSPEAAIQAADQAMYAAKRLTCW